MTSPHVVCDHRTATFYDEYVSLATTDGRIEADYVLPDRDGDAPHVEYLFSDRYETTGAELHIKHGEWQLHIHYKKELESDTSERATTTHGTVFGVDLGVNNLTVSTGTFWTGDEFDQWRREYETRRGDLQECGTRWAHENSQASDSTEDHRYADICGATSRSGISCKLPAGWGTPGSGGTRCKSTAGYRVVPTTYHILREMNL